MYVTARAVVDYKLPTIAGREAGLGFVWRPGMLPRMHDYAADFELAGKAALQGQQLTSRLILFRVYYVGGAEYEAARRLIGISAMTWANWAEQVRWLVGKELLRRRIFPPGRYFKEPDGVGETDGVSSA